MVTLKHEATGAVVVAQWQSSRFEHQRTRVQIHPSVIKEHLITFEGKKIKKKWPLMAHTLCAVTDPIDCVLGPM